MEEWHAAQPDIEQARTADGKRAIHHCRRSNGAVATHSAPNLPFQFQTLVAELEGNLK
jgi:hypothetical protein